jgi:hypothetical protein
VVDIGAFESAYSNLVVTNTNDSGAGSLRQAILNANSDGIDSVITFEPSATRHHHPGQRCRPVANNGTLTINGNGMANTIINGADTYRHLSVSSGSGLTLNGLTLEHGRQATGGAIMSEGTLTINNVTCTTTLPRQATAAAPSMPRRCDHQQQHSVRQFRRERWRAAAHVSGRSAISGSRFENNVAASGGALDAGAPRSRSAVPFSPTTPSSSSWGDSLDALAHISNSVFSGNTTDGNGGAIANMSTGVLTLVNSTLSGNSAANRAVFNDNTGTIYLYNSILANSVTGETVIRTAASSTPATASLKTVWVA